MIEPSETVHGVDRGRWFSQRQTQGASAQMECWESWDQGSPCRGKMLGAFIACLCSCHKVILFKHPWERDA